jgi:hypothetical protein
LLDSMAVLLSVFGGASILIEFVLIYIPPAVYEGSFFARSLLTFFVVCVLDSGHSNRSGIES